LPDGSRPAPLDISLPVHNGFAIARLLRRLKQTRDMVLVAHTAFIRDFVAGSSRPGEFDGYCQKGHPLKNLIGLIREFSASIC
jgi:two-component system OmpR family response regulator